MTPTSTTIWANFGGHNPRAGVEITRSSDFTAAWNQSYIRVEGLAFARATSPQTINYWQSSAPSPGGALDTNGGYGWVIRNDTFTQNLVSP